MSEKHLSWARILDFVEGHDEGSELAAHLADCASCAARVQRAREMLALLEALRLPEPPETLLEGARQLLRDEPADLAEWSQRIGRRLREIWARPVADSLQPSLVLRGAGEAATRLFEAGGFSIALMSEDEGSGLTLQGQVAPLEGGELPAGGRAFLGSSEEILDDCGEFRLEEVQSPATELTIVLEDLLIRLRLPS